MDSFFMFKDEEALKRFKCSHCRQLLKEAVQPTCGHRLCLRCADHLIVEKCPPQCPQDDCGKYFLTFKSGCYYFPDRFVRREIQELEVVCRRCNWVGTYHESSLHCQDCKHVCTFCQSKMSYYELNQHTASCEAYQSNFVQDLCHPQQETDIDVESRTFGKVDVQAKTMLFNDIKRILENIKTETVVLLRGIAELKSLLRSSNATPVEHFTRSNYDGTMIWKIPEFSRRKADAQNSMIFSLPFYSGRHGYKMCLQLYIMGDGIGKGTHLSLFFVVMRGEFDNILQWPFTHKVTFKLLNQAGGRDIVDTLQPDPMNSSFRKPKSDMNIASGCPRFVSHTDLERGGFIVDDTIFIKCVIDTSTIHHP